MELPQRGLQNQELIWKPPDNYGLLGNLVSCTILSILCPLWSPDISHAKSINTLWPRNCKFLVEVNLVNFWGIFFGILIERKSLKLIYIYILSHLTQTILIFRTIITRRWYGSSHRSVCFLSHFYNEKKYLVINQLYLWRMKMMHKWSKLLGP